MQGTRIGSLVRELSSHMLWCNQVRMSQLLSSCPTTTESVHCGKDPSGQCRSLSLQSRLWVLQLRPYTVEKSQSIYKQQQQQQKKTHKGIVFQVLKQCTCGCFLTEDEVVGWHHQLHGREFEQAPGVGDGQGSLAWCWSQSRTWLSDWTELILTRVPSKLYNPNYRGVIK